MNRDESIKVTEEFVRKIIRNYDSGHDWYHIERVRKLALFINEQEAIADPFILDIAAILHDSADSKFSGASIEQGYKEIGEFLDKTGMSEIKEQIIGVIRNVSFSKKNPSGNLKDPVLLIIQDADKLDAMGAIGIARAFNYGGFRNNAIYNPDIEFYNNNLKEQQTNKTSSTISHFYEKLLVLKYRMNTLTAKRLAIERHEFLLIFLKQFYKEWNFDSDKRKI
jgi:uncharacterized protein